MPAENLKTLRIFVHGTVQGVNYRRWLQGEARKRGLHGWTRNRMDGSVEAMIHGMAGEVDALIEACGRGPSLARVDKVDAEAAQYGGPADFLIESTV